MLAVAESGSKSKKNNWMIILLGNNAIEEKYPGEYLLHKK